MNNYSEYELFLINNGFMDRCVVPEYNYDNKYNKMNSNSKFLNPEEGFYLGNMLKEEYIPYKNMKVIKPNINDERDALLQQIQMYCFAAHDINLYLDTHPEDKSAIELYNKYNIESKRLSNEFTKRYGALKVDDNDVLSKYPWSWINMPWPWDK